MEKYTNEEQYDLEWIRLIEEAKEIGLTLEEIRVFLENPTQMK